MNFEIRSNSSYNKGQLFQERNNTDLDVAVHKDKSSCHTSTGTGEGYLEIKVRRQASPEAEQDEGSRGK